MRPGDFAAPVRPRFDLPKLAATLVALGALVLLAAACGAVWGDQPISLRLAFSNPESPDAVILWSLRIPRVALAALVGAALSGSGCALQALTHNPLADPFVLGVSGGAALGATVALLFGLNTLFEAQSFWAALPNVSLPSLFAFVGAVLATAFVFLGGTRSPSSALLAGVVFNSVAAALITCIKALSAPDQVGDILHWLAGALGYESAGTLAVTFLLQLLALGSLWALAGRLNLMSLGDDEAAALGVEVRSTRRWVLLWCSLSVAAAVALSGLVGFVGLIVPHLLRRVLGPDCRVLLPASALGGAAFLIAADLAARLLFRTLHAEPPVGVVTALVGGPLFLWLLHRTTDANDSHSGVGGID